MSDVNHKHDEHVMQMKRQVNLVMLYVIDFGAVKNVVKCKG